MTGDSAEWFGKELRSAYATIREWLDTMGETEDSEIVHTLQNMEGK